MSYAMVCGGCGAVAPEASPFVCPEIRDHDDIDHVLSRRLELGGAPFLADESPETFVRYRSRLGFWHLAQVHGLSDGDVVDEVKRLDDAVALVDGHGFVETPCFEASALGRAISEGSLWLKDETNNVSGSHKARHLMNVALYLAVAKRLGIISADAPLAISSCGNAALAAAVIAKAAKRPLIVFVPDWADPVVVDRLSALGATIEVCHRTPGVLGDPCTHAMRLAVKAGALPFSCQGSDNGLAVEGGLTLGYEIVQKLRREGVSLERIYVQVGGGALLSSIVQAFFDARAMGIVRTLPKFYAVQAEGAAPLSRAYERAAEQLGTRPTGTPLEAELVESCLRYAVRHRSKFMTPWNAPKSIAHGILDDETYDWVWILRGLLRSGGAPIVVPDPTIQTAHDLARAHTEVTPCMTGVAGLAGLIAHRQAEPSTPNGPALVLLTGKDRSADKE